MTNLCLNMIVKDEAANLPRCLASVKPWISSWCIVDTGSTDDTRDVIVNALGTLPGSLVNAKFVNFGATRTLALEHARALPAPYDYLLLVDADHELVVTDDRVFEWLQLPAYELTQTDPWISYANTRLVRRDCSARYVGVTHEYLSTQFPAVALAGARIVDHCTGANRPGKFERDIALLRDAVAADPNDARSWFYLAQSYRDAGMLAHALAAYQTRAKLPGWAEETWYSLLSIARVLDKIPGTTDGQVIAAYLAAYAARNSRAEPLADLAKFYGKRGNWTLAQVYASACACTRRPDDRLFVEDDCYDPVRLKRRLGGIPLTPTSVT